MNKTDYNMCVRTIDDQVIHWAHVYNKYYMVSLSTALSVDT